MRSCRGQFWRTRGVPSTIAKAFDRMLLEEIDWLLQEETDLPFVGERTHIERRYWWWYLHEVKEGTLELPADLKGAA